MYSQALKHQIRCKFKILTATGKALTVPNQQVPGVRVKVLPKGQQK